ncbi:hypothetical protein ANANG_G00118370 [Anguilla anguilla]|uniref:Uncharacterized protein n=1 Tax=Anguilla anguilla TaxID=7936 RepID=A0A9D3MDU1_ANGAN|nr:hypothetical protein ANANG_G00118370 [Anguilla anguilla]
MAQKRSSFLEALNRSEARKDGGFKQNWSFDSEEKKTDSSVETMSEGGEQRDPTPEGKKSPPLKPFCTSDSLKTYERRPNQLRMYKGSGGGLNKLGVGKTISETPPTVTSPVLPSRTNYFILSPAPSQGVVVQGRFFQHANAPAVIRKAAQSNLDLKERKDYTTQQIQRVELDSIILTCPEIPAASNLVLGGNIKRRIQSKRTTSLEAKKVEALAPEDYFTVCGKCGKQSENHVKCQNCGNPLVQDPPGPAEAASPLARPAVRPHASSGPHSLLPRPSTGPKGNRRQPAAKQNEPEDPIVLSSDDDEEEEEDADNGSTGSASRMDSISPRPADSAHSSPAPSGGRVEAAVKGASELEEMTDITDAVSKISAPRKHRMKDQFGNMVPDGANHSPTLTKRRKVSLSYKLDSIILECRSVRVGTLRRMVTKPVIFTVEYIQIETEAPKPDALDRLKLRASELTSCEWCSTRKLPSIFLQTTPAECLRLRSQLKMSQDGRGCGTTAAAKTLTRSTSS